jgi:hypothetical protein
MAQDGSDKYQLVVKDLKEIPAVIQKTSVTERNNMLGVYMALDGNNKDGIKALSH